MKKSLLIILFYITIFIFTGCTKCSYNIEIDNKDNITISETLGIKSELLENAGADYFKNQMEHFNQSGYIIKDYKDDIYTGKTRIKENIKFSLAMDNMPKALQKQSTNEFKILKGILKNTYKINLLLDYNDVMEDLTGQRPETKEEIEFKKLENERIEQEKLAEAMASTKVVSKKQMTDPVTGDITEETKYSDGSVVTSRYNPKSMQQFNDSIAGAMNSVTQAPGVLPSADITIKIPVKAKKHNASKVISDTEYQWNLLSEKPVLIVLEYEKTNVVSWIFISLFCIFIVILIVNANLTRNSKSQKITGNCVIRGL